MAFSLDSEKKRWLAVGAAVLGAVQLSGVYNFLTLNPYMQWVLVGLLVYTAWMVYDSQV